ncbi:MAG: 5-(carboxyamino)imidazole ribonucleotide mutase [Bacillota bacterium]
MPLVGIVMGSDSDLQIMKMAAEILEGFGVEYEMTIISAHRSPKRALEYASTATERGLEVIIAGAGGAAHLPGVLAAMTPLPVIGVPIKTNTLDGVDSLYSIVQMPGGIPVATVSINGAKNAGILAVQILGGMDPALRQKMVEYKKRLAKEVNDKAVLLEEIGYQEYLNSQKK